MKAQRLLMVFVVLAALFAFACASVQATTLTVMANAVKGGKNTQDVGWLEEILPAFERQMKSEGLDVTVNFIPTGINDEDYKARLALDIKGGGGPDVIAFDHFWVPEFAEANYLLPIDKYVAQWPEWANYYDSMKKMGAYNGRQYLIMGGTDVRMLYYNKELFRKAGLPVPWEPKSWDDLLKAARTLKKKLPGVIPLQINAGTEMGEATTMQGAYMVLLGAGGNLYDWNTGKWIARSPALLNMLKFYKTVYVDEKLGDGMLQVSPKARDKSFALFSTGKIAVYAEGTWMWTSVISPNGAWGITDRDSRIGWTPFPGSGKPGASPVVSISGGGGWVINPNTRNPDLAWKLLAYINSLDSTLKHYAVKPGIPARKEMVEQPLVQKDSFIAGTTKKLVQYTTFRPGFPEYPKVSYQVQLMTEKVVTGQATPEQALDAYAEAVTGIVGKDRVEVLK